MRTKKRNVVVLREVQFLKALACDDAKGSVSHFAQVVGQLQDKLLNCRGVESDQAARLNRILDEASTFDPLVFQCGVLSWRKAQAASREIAKKLESGKVNLDDARNHLLQATASHEIIKKEYRRNLGKLTRAQAQAFEHTREDMFASRIGGGRGALKFVI